jgi:hypothetical protein
MCKNKLIIFVKNISENKYFFEKKKKINFY